MQRYKNLFRVLFLSIWIIAASPAVTAYLLSFHGHEHQLSYSASHGGVSYTFHHDDEHHHEHTDNDNRTVAYFTPNHDDPALSDDHGRHGHQVTSSVSSVVCVSNQQRIAETKKIAAEVHPFLHSISTQDLTLSSDDALITPFGSNDRIPVSTSDLRTIVLLI